MSLLLYLALTLTLLSSDMFPVAVTPSVSDTDVIRQVSLAVTPPWDRLQSQALEGARLVHEVIVVDDISYGCHVFESALEII